MVKEYVLPSAVIFTDKNKVYDDLAQKGHIHYRIKHSAKVYVDGDVHTQTIEGFWSLFKRGLSGVYRAVSTRYLQGYIDEYVSRHNHCFDSVPMFWAFLSQVARWAPAAPTPSGGSPA